MSDRKRAACPPAPLVAAGGASLAGCSCTGTGGCGGGGSTCSRGDAHDRALAPCSDVPCRSTKRSMPRRSHTMSALWSTRWDGGGAATLASKPTLSRCARRMEPRLRSTGTHAGLRSTRELSRPSWRRCRAFAGLPHPTCSATRVLGSVRFRMLCSVRLMTQKPSEVMSEIATPGAQAEPLLPPSFQAGAGTESQQPPPVRGGQVVWRGAQARQVGETCVGRCSVLGEDMLCMCGVHSVRSFTHPHTSRRPP